MFILRNIVLLTLTAVPTSLLAQEAPIPAIAEACASCHQLDRSEGNTAHAAPPLFYAGNKYRQEWLEQWLQAPYRLRPAGGFFADHVITEDGIDSVDEASLQDHMAVDSSKAADIADWLMSLTPMDDLLAASSDYQPGSVSPRMGAMDFVKFKGCGGCHRDTPEYGGLSGPELYTAWQRLQPQFIVSFIKDPRAWNPDSAMPSRGLNDGQIHKLADYLKILTNED
ncbi:MAG: c-type cytochrome [Pseudomonadales bacterium]|nr:c-type cytochrome [Pseudomonadales bacterium]